MSGTNFGSELGENRRDSQVQVPLDYRMVLENLGEEWHALGLMSYHGAPWGLGDGPWMADVTREDIADIRTQLLSAATEIARLGQAMETILETARWYASNGDRLPLEVDHALCVEVLDAAERALEAGEVLADFAAGESATEKPSDG